MNLSGVDLEHCILTGARLRFAIGLGGLRFAGTHGLAQVAVSELRACYVVVHEGALRVVEKVERVYEDRVDGYGCS